LEQRNVSGVGIIVAKDFLVKKAWNSLVFILIFAFGFWAQAVDLRDYAGFLNRLGFEDYSAQAQKSRSAGGVNAVSSLVLKANVDRYQVVNASRNLTLAIVEESFDRLESREIQEKVLNLAAYLLEPAPFVASEPLPAAINALTDSANYVKAREVYLRSRILHRFRDEKQTLLAVMMDLAPAKKQAALESLLDTYLVSKYMDIELRQTRYWGRALSAALVKYARDHAQPGLENALTEKLGEKGLWLGNFLSSTVKYKNQKQEVVSVKIASGDFVNEYSKGSESYFITIGVMPTSRSDLWLAERSGLIGRKLQAAFYLLPEEETALLAKVRARETLTSSEKRHYAFLQNEPNPNGYSHVGILEVKRDPVSGIEMPWVWDIYPSGEVGGVRFLGLEGFAYAEQFRSVGFTHYDARKFHSYYVKKTTEQGYLSTVWKSYRAGLDENDEIAEDRQNTYLWPAKISAAEVQRLQKTPPEQAEAWFAKEIAPRVLNVMKGYMVSKDALAFAENFANMEGAAYCSQALVLAFLQGVNVDPQASPDQYPKFLDTVEKFHKDLGGYYKRGERIIAPSGFAWQSQLVESHVMIYFDRHLPERNQEKLLAPLRPRSRVTPLPSPLLPSPPGLQNYFEDL
jgi:hypothetical protein